MRKSPQQLRDRAILLKHSLSFGHFSQYPEIEKYFYWILDTMRAGAPPHPDLRLELNDKGKVASKSRQFEGTAAEVMTRLREWMQTVDDFADQLLAIKSYHTKFQFIYWQAKSVLTDHTSNLNVDLCFAWKNKFNRWNHWGYQELEEAGLTALIFKLSREKYTLITPSTKAIIRWRDRNSRFLRLSIRQLIEQDIILG